jgi:ribosomal protein S18 acetylase RimI-like enzyme
MKFEVTASPSPEDEAFVVARTRAYNAAFMPNDVQALCVFARTDDGEIVGGLTGKTYWNYLEVSFLWVHEQHRGFGHATALMSAAEAEALRRGCFNVVLDTFSFQALGFYKKLGYEEFGQLSRFTGGHVRHFLYKSLGNG